MCPVVIKSTVFPSDSKVMSSGLVENSVECLQSQMLGKVLVCKYHYFLSMVLKLFLSRKSCFQCRL